MEADVRERYLTHLNKELDRYGNYHDHKERMAWTATAAFIPGIILFGAAAATRLPSTFPESRYFLIAILVVFMAAALMFVNMQLRMRWIAADMEDGFRRALSGLLSRNKALTNDDIEVPEEDDAAYRPLWAAFIDTALHQSKTDRQSALRWGLLWALLLQWPRIDNRVQTELASYAIIAFATLISVTAVLFG